MGKVARRLLERSVLGIRLRSTAVMCERPLQMLIDIDGLVLLCCPHRWVECYREELERQANFREGRI